MNRISTCLWFDGQAEEAAAFYVAIFKNSSIVETLYCLQEMHRPKGSVLTVSFVLDGQEFLALNGGPEFTFSPAISFMVNCETQEEIDDYWKKLTADGGKEVECGWLTDKFGVSWQIVPSALLKMLNDPDTAAAERAFAAMLKMKKLDIAQLKQAFAGS
ncbi:MAG: 3-demethylubiquinone-9 3-methyltransferase [Proteobacteria bacterium]|nr:3-demethylubiquinone-9 3-methyltransferase [Pseudomonadota bacterium]